MSRDTSGKPALTEDEQQMMQFLSAEDRKAYLALDPRVRKFLMHATEPERDFYLTLDVAEHTRFALLPYELRMAYIRLTPSEKVLIKKLPDAEMQRYLKLNPEGRRSFQANSKVAQEQQKTAQSIASRASVVARAAIARLGEWAEGKPELSGLANSLAHNLLHGGKSSEAAESEVLQALLNSPQILPQLTQTLSEKVDREAFRSARYTLPALIAKSIRGDMDLPVIISTLVTEMGGSAAKPPNSKDNSKEDSEISEVRLKMRGGIST